MSAKRDYTRCPLRQCQWLLFCELCQKVITQGQLYYDGQYLRRAHVHCALQEKEESAARGSKR